ncbi:uncharacterized protein LAJ45_10822 [Morchella importuna]|uniref:uncharacterized protein n=1 Tax=Morchella importuna TaxID=1174673 RepID=UPI001E8E9A62|nr:uncharacterized protein LAJ45_10822 [Morchella importuna]KAH8145158.1 hypothetical protein LAJ45_10822 [Morchella importuna]
MSFGFGDFIAGVNLCDSIIKACGEINNASSSHKDFAASARALRDGLNSLMSAIRDRNTTAKTESFRHRNDETTWQSLREITLDFRATLETIQARLRQYPVGERAGLERRMSYWFNAKGEVQELLERCRYHVTIINFVLEPFKIKVMTDIRESIQNLTGEVLDVKKEVLKVGTRMEEGFDDMRELLQRFNCQPGPSMPVEPLERRPRAVPPPPPPPPPALEITTDSLDIRFKNQMRDDGEDTVSELTDVTVGELTKSAVIWLEKGRHTVDDATDMAKLTPTQYLWLRKAKWIVTSFNGHPELQKLALTDKDSLLHKLCRKLENEIKEVFNDMKIKGLQIPSMDSIHSLDPHEFSPLVEPLVEPDTTMEGYGEDLILNIQLSGAHYQTQPITFLVFRQGGGSLRCVERVRSTSRRGNVVKDIIKEYIIDKNIWHMRPLYMFHPQEGCWNIILYQPLEAKSFTFSNHKDLFAFQHAFLDANARFISSHFKGIRYQEPALTRSSREFTSGLIQLWLEKPRPRLDPEGNTPSTEASLSPTTTQTQSMSSWSAAPSVALSTTTTTHRQQDGTTVFEVKKVESSRFFACLNDTSSSDKRRVFITFVLDDTISFSNTSCCSKNLHPGGGGKSKRLPELESDVCCKKLVIETVIKGGDFSAKVLEAKGEGMVDDMSIALGEEHLPKGKKIKLSYFNIIFESKGEKLRFMNQYHELEKLRITRERITRALMTDMKERERHGDQLRMDELPKSPRRSSTFSAFSFKSARRGSNLS